jgi:hypothetical protein
MLSGHLDDSRNKVWVIGKWVGAYKSRKLMPLRGGGFIDSIHNIYKNFVCNETASVV